MVRRKFGIVGMLWLATVLVACGPVSGSSEESQLRKKASESIALEQAIQIAVIEAERIGYPFNDRDTYAWWSDGSWRVGLVRTDRLFGGGLFEVELSKEGKVIRALVTGH